MEQAASSVSVARSLEVTMKASESFEQKIHRVYELLEASGAEVTWDDHVPDPDNPSQQRQMDITIKRNGKITHIECRQHQFPQDVMWIEQLMGRRISLAADAIIAVSSSGFTKGALLKAEKHGIIPRDLRELTDSEIKSWGGQLTLTLYFYEYSDLNLSLCFEVESIQKLDVDLVRSELATHPGMHSIFNAAAKYLGTLNLVNTDRIARPVEFGVRLQLDGFRLSGEPVVEVDLHGKAILVSREVTSPTILTYGEPGTNALKRGVTIEDFALGETSIVHAGSKISVFLDMSKVEMPPFCQFRFFRVAGQHEMDHEAFEFLGLEKLRVHGHGMNVKICST
jgi:hypothetical protein